MRIFYIDYENVMDSGLNGIAKLTDSDTVKIFYSENAQRMSFGTHRRIIESKAVFTNVAGQNFAQLLFCDKKTIEVEHKFSTNISVLRYILLFLLFL